MKVTGDQEFSRQSRDILVLVVGNISLKLSLELCWAETSVGGSVASRTSSDSLQAALL